MYDELVKRLREDKSWVEQGATDTEHEIAEHIQQSADAIEELSDDNAALNGTIANLLEQIKDLGKPRWISVEERLPEEKTYVLILFDTIAGKMSGVCFLYKDDDGHNCWTWLDRIGKNLFDIQPTHWMPLPEPPEEE